jgi:hypothetical protein
MLSCKTSLISSPLLFCSQSAASATGLRKCISAALILMILSVAIKTSDFYERMELVIVQFYFSILTGFCIFR